MPRQSDMAHSVSERRLLQLLKPAETTWCVRTEPDRVCWKLLGCSCGYDGHMSDCKRNSIARLVLYSDECNVQGAVTGHQSLFTENISEKRDKMTEKECLQ